MAIERRSANPKHLGDLRGRVLARVVHRPRHRELLGAHDRRTPTAPPARAGGRAAGLRAFADQVALELRQRSENVEDEPAAGRGRVDRLAEGAKADSASLERGDGVDEMAERAPEAIEAPDDERVSLAGVLERTAKFGPLG